MTVSLRKGLLYVWQNLFRSSAELVAIFVVFIIALIVYNSFGSSIFQLRAVNFLSSQFLPLLLASIGQALIMITRGIDLSIGAVIALVMAVFATTTTLIGTPLALCLALAVGVAAGATNGALVAVAGLPPIIVTLATSFFWYGVTLLILPKPGGWVPPELVKAYSSGIAGIPLGLVALAACLLLWKAISRTHFGLSIYATGGNEHGAYSSGIRTQTIKIGAYALAGLFIGLAGVALTLQTGTGDANIGTSYTLNTIAAAILGGVLFTGGVGYMRGVVMGALVVAMLPIIMLLIGISPFYQLVVQGSVLIIAIASKHVLVTRRKVIS